MEKTKQQTTINSIIEDRYVWTCLSPIALQLNFLKKLFPKIQGNASLCKRNNGDSPLIIIPINGHRFEDKIIPCIYRYESSDGKKNDLTVNAYFPHNPYLQRIAIMAWETEGVSIEKTTDVLGEMSCETVSIIASGNQFNTFSSQILMDDLNNQAIPINISLLMVKGWLKSLATDVVSEESAVKEVKKQMDKKKLTCDIVNKYMTLDNILTIASRRANHLNKALAKIDHDFSTVKNFIQNENFDLYYGSYFKIYTSLTLLEAMKVLESFFEVSDLKPIIKYFPANWQSEYSYALSNMEYFRKRQNKKIQNKLYQNMCEQLKKKIIADINKIIR